MVPLIKVYMIIMGPGRLGGKMPLTLHPPCGWWKGKIKPKLFSIVLCSIFFKVTTK